MAKKKPPGRLVGHLRGSLEWRSAEPLPSGYGLRSDGAASPNEHLLFLVHHGAVRLEPFFSRRGRGSCLFLVRWFYSWHDTVSSGSSLFPVWGWGRVTSPCLQVLFLMHCGAVRSGPSFRSGDGLGALSLCAWFIPEGRPLPCVEGLPPRRPAPCAIDHTFPRSREVKGDHAKPLPVGALLRPKPRSRRRGPAGLHESKWIYTCIHRGWRTT